MKTENIAKEFEKYLELTKEQAIQVSIMASYLQELFHKQVDNLNAKRKYWEDKYKELKEKKG